VIRPDVTSWRVSAITLNERPSCESATIAPRLPIIIREVEIISAGSDKSRRGNSAIPYTRRVPTKADTRGSRPLAFVEGRDRRITAAARSNRKAIVENRIARWIT
jgi:hypothetical protein